MSFTIGSAVCPPAAPMVVAPRAVAERALAGAEIDLSRVDAHGALTAFVFTAGSRRLGGSLAPVHDAAMAGLRQRAASLNNTPQGQFGLREALQRMVSSKPAKEIIQSLNQNQLEALSALFAQGLWSSMVNEFLLNPALDSFGGVQAVLDLIYACRVEGVENLAAPFIPVGATSRLQSVRSSDIDLELERLKLALRQASERPTRLRAEMDTRFNWSIDDCSAQQRAALQELNLGQTKYGDIGDHTFVKVNVAAFGDAPKSTRLSLVVSPTMLKGNGLKLTAAQIIRVTNVAYRNDFGMVELHIRLGRFDRVNEIQIDFLRKHFELSKVPYRLIISREGAGEEIVAATQLTEVVKAKEPAEAPIKMPWTQEIKDMLQKMIPARSINLKGIRTLADFEAAARSSLRTYEQDDIDAIIVELLRLREVAPASRVIIEGERRALKSEQQNTLSYTSIRRLYTMAVAFMTKPESESVDEEALAYAGLQQTWEKGAEEFVARAQAEIDGFVAVAESAENAEELMEFWEALEVTPDTRFMTDVQGENLLTLREVLQMMQETSLVVDWSERVVGMMRDYIARYDAMAEKARNPEIVVTVSESGVNEFTNNVVNGG